MGDYGVSIVAQLNLDAMRMDIVLDAIELLNNGYPLDEETVEALESIGVDYGEFIKEFQIPTCDDL